MDALTWSRWRPISEHDEGKEANNHVPNISSTLNQCRELRARRGEQNSIIAAPKRSTNPTKFVIDENVKTFWFSLIASHNQKCKAPLKQIPCRYLRVKDGNITVSCIKKYLMQKLNLRSENEVEISLQGRLLLPTLEMRKLIDLWLHTNTTPPLQKKTAFLGSSARDFVLTLTYARRPHST
ncbi:E3 ubiquitin protein ligase DRIP2-like [Salvia miltiorrhiza]|uniref:E3 ubiquitin protein ligase DRIP2-like n=1 Tax=Salvia miltiorrhiza TaxID=226208 RepID=UPI0025AC1887|nr:E3 ubiquitin protein ligase DRIP2-like [Salvia miltiorrhiza]